MGARSRRFGTISEAGDLRLATDGAGVLALGAGAALPEDVLATLADVRSQSRAMDRRLRFHGCRDGAISSALRAHSHGGGNPEDPALQRNCASDRNVDATTVSEAIPGDLQCKFLIHDRDSIFSPSLDQELESFGLRVLRTPVRAPQANAYCERLVGTIRRECLDFLIPLSGSHLRVILNEWVRHYNQGRPHMSLGPGIPADNANNKEAAILQLRTRARHRLPGHCEIRATPILGGLHHEYYVEKIAA